MSKVKVIYIAGVGRSGTTLVGRVLGQSPGAIFVGEAKSLPRQATPGSKCGCGENVVSCPLWSNVLDGIDVDAIERVRGELRNRDLLFSIPSVTNSLDELAKFYQSIARESNSDLIIDSSGFPSYLLCLSQAPNIDVRVLHLVRDPRAIAHAWWYRPIHENKKNSDLLSRSYLSLMYENPLRSSLIWVLWNHIICKHWGEGKYYLMKYENFCRCPRYETHKALDHLRVAAKPEWIDGRRLELPRQHTIRGNPNRFTEGITSIEERDRWKEKLSASTNLLVTMLTFPMLNGFGYSYSLKS